MSAKNSVHIEPLRKDNYDTWKVQAEAILVRAGLHEHLTDETLDAGKDLLAKAELLLIISPSELRLVKSCKTAKSVWDTLKNAYESCGPARKATLLKKLLQKKMKNTETAREHINSFMDIVDKLKAMEITLDTDLLSVMLLYSLPDTYENFRVAIESRDNLPSPEELKTKIIEESEARSNKEENTEGEEAFYGRKPKPKPKFTSKKFLKCEKCNKKGHTTENCWYGQQRIRLLQNVKIPE